MPPCSTVRPASCQPKTCGRLAKPLRCDSNTCATASAASKLEHGVAASHAGLVIDTQSAEARAPGRVLHVFGAHRRPFRKAEPTVRPGASRRNGPRADRRHSTPPRHRAGSASISSRFAAATPSIESKNFHMRVPHVRDHAHLGQRDGGQLANLAGVVHPHLEHPPRHSPGQPKNRERHADVILNSRPSRPVASSTESKCAIASLSSSSPALPVTPDHRAAPFAGAPTCPDPAMRQSVSPAPPQFPRRTHGCSPTTAAAARFSSPPLRNVPIEVRPPQRKVKIVRRKVRESMLQPGVFDRSRDRGGRVPAPWLADPTVRGRKVIYGIRNLQHFPCHRPVVECDGSVLQNLVSFVAFAGQMTISPSWAS